MRRHFNSTNTLPSAAAQSSAQERALALPTQRTSRLTALAATFAALLMAFVLLGQLPASAHDRLIDSNPKDGATLKKAPVSISLKFNEKVQDLGAQIKLLNQDGKTVVQDEPKVDGTLVSYVLPELPNGDYSVAWRVVSADSHPIEGTLTFAVADPKNPISSDPAGTTESPDPAAEPTMTTLGEDPLAPADPADDANGSPDKSDLTKSDTGSGDTGSDDTGSNDAKQDSANNSANDSATSNTTQSDSTDSHELPWTGIAIGAGLGLIVGIIGTIYNRQRNKQDK